MVTAKELNAYDVLCNDYIVFTQGTIPAGNPVSRGRSVSIVSADDVVRTVVAAPKKAAVSKKIAAPKAAVVATSAAVVAESLASESAVAESTEAHAEATVTTTVTVTTIVDGVETVEVIERSVDHVDADTIHDDNPDAIETTVHVTEQTIVGGKVVSESESYSTEETES